MPTPENYRIFAVKYAHHARRSTENFIGGDSHDVPMPLDYFVWAVVGESRAFIVDTGFDTSMAQQRGRTITNPVEAGLKRDRHPARVGGRRHPYTYALRPRG
jgi:hypothetical protein